MTAIQTEYSLFYLIPCAGLAFAYAWFLYQKKAPWPQSVNRALAVLRFIVSFILAALLLGPYLKQLFRTAEKPIVAIAVDNSQSLALVNQENDLNLAKQELRQAVGALEEAGIESAIYGLSGQIAADSLEALAFDQPSSHLSSLLKEIQADHENRQLSGIVLLTDGIYNQGTAPSYLPQPVPIYPVAIGDTLPQRDINLKALYANKIAYLGNKFPLVAEVQQIGFSGKEVMLSLSHKGKVISRKPLRIEEGEALQRVEFLVTASEQGTQRYVVSIQPSEGEFTTKNNSKTAYLDVLDSREKILLIASSPHPDIKAIKSAVEKQENYQLDVYIPTLEADLRRQSVNVRDKYDLVILHQIPDYKADGMDVLEELMDRKAALWFILGKYSNLRRFNQLNLGVEILAQPNQRDQVTPIFQNAFNRFTFSSDNISSLTKFPPVSVPFGEYRLSNDTEVLLSQRVGNIATDKPLLTVRTSENQKVAVMMGEGVWEWRLQDYALNQNHQSFDELVSKLIQYLSTKEDRRKFRVYPANNEMLNTDQVTFETEVYNDIYEEVFGQNIRLALTNEQGESQDYTYANVGPGFRYSVRGLSPGVYRYKATCTLAGEALSSEGQFSIRMQELEALNTTADFPMLRQLASQSGGAFYTAAEIRELRQFLVENRDPDVIYTDEQSSSLLQSYWLLALLLLLPAIEWGVRKYRGGY